MFQIAKNSARHFFARKVQDHYRITPQKSPQSPSAATTLMEGKCNHIFRVWGTIEGVIKKVILNVSVKKILAGFQAILSHYSS